MKRITYYTVVLGAIIAIQACTRQSTITSTDHASQLLMKCLAAHGGGRYDKAAYTFEFRGNTYQFKNNDSSYEYMAYKTAKDGTAYTDVLDNGDFSRTTAGKEVELTEKQRTGLSNSLNSVIYFATLPHKLLDPAVNLTYRGSTTIKGQAYEVLQVTFDQEGGGQDHDDTYHYWINQSTDRIDYLAYNYQVNGGGARFRVAYNTRIVDGIVFQDYSNYKAPFETPLADLPALYESGDLKLLSEIKTENVRSL